MEAQNHGPYAKLLRLSNGRYIRMVDPVPPKIFVDFKACCNSEINAGEFDLLTQLSQQSFVSNTSLMSKKGSTQINDKSASKQYTKLYTPQLTDGHNRTLSRTSSNNSYDSELSEELEGQNYVEDQQEIPEEPENNDTHPMVYRESINELRIESIWEKEARSIKDIDEDGTPILFYTKKREKPALLMMIVDDKMQVIFMKRNKASRFFPIKLIDKFITSPEIIEAEFSRQIKSDPTVRIKNMVLFNASNFTECVAIQFAEEPQKHKFISEVNRIKDLIKKNN